LLIHNTVTDRLFRNERLLLLWAAIIVGACGGGFALGVRLLIDMNWWAFSYLRSLDRPLFVLLVLAIPALGGLVLGLIARISMAVGEPGVEELRKSFLTTVGILAVPTALLRLLACAVTMTMGGSVGAEGPVARASTALGSWFARRFGLDDSRAQLLIACGVSASIAGIFHTPFAAVVFAAEVVLGVYAIRRLAYLLLAAGVSLGLSRWGAGLDAPFSAPPFVLQSPLDLVIHAVVGTGCGALAVLLLKATEWLVSMRDRCAGVWPSVLGGLMVGGVVLMVPQAVGGDYPALSGLLSNSVTISFVVAVLVAKLTATALTLGSRGVGGVFSPSLVVGGGLGWLVGRAVHGVAPQTFAPASSYAAVGMVSMASAVVHAPLTAAAFIVEITRSYDAVVPGVVAGVAASIMSATIRDEPVSGHRPGLPAQGPVQSSIELTPTTIEELIDPLRDTVPASLSAFELVNRLPAVRQSVLVVADGASVMGVISTRAAMRKDGEALEGKTARDLMIDTGVLHKGDSVAQAIVQFMGHDAPALPVVSEQSQLVGLVWRSDLMDFCAHDLLQNDLYFSDWAPMSGGDPSTRPLRHDVVALPVPPAFVGKTLREVDLGKRFGVVCVGIRRATNTGAFVAVHVRPNLELRADDVLILTGNISDLDQIGLLTQQDG